MMKIEHGRGYDFDVMDRLYEKGYIHNPKGKTKSIAFTQEGLAKAREVFDGLFGVVDPA